MTEYIVGIDEAGRGPLAGPVAVGAVMVSAVALDAVVARFEGLRDSKHLSKKRRARIYEQLRVLRQEGALSFAVALVSHTTIDARGIVFAIKSGIDGVLTKIGVLPENARVLLDGSLHAPICYVHQTTIIGGDETVPIIALASIAAKVVRDRKMIMLAKQYPLYGFEAHKGYGTAAHYVALANHGVSLAHRRTFLKNLDAVRETLRTGKK